jgi:hypothetical protein
MDGLPERPRSGDCSARKQQPAATGPGVANRSRQFRWAGHRFRGARPLSASRSRASAAPPIARKEGHRAELIADLTEMRTFGELGDWDAVCGRDLHSSFRWYHRSHTAWLHVSGSGHASRARSARRDGCFAPGATASPARRKVVRVLYFVDGVVSAGPAWRLPVALLQRSCRAASVRRSSIRMVVAREAGGRGKIPIRGRGQRRVTRGDTRSAGGPARDRVGEVPSSRDQSSKPAFGRPFERCYVVVRSLP